MLRVTKTIVISFSITIVTTLFQYSALKPIVCTSAATTTVTAASTPERNAPRRFQKSSSLRKTKFPPIIIINLKRHSARLEKVTDQLTSVGIINGDFNVLLNAVDGNELSQHELKQNTTSALARWLMTPGIVGCFLSHRNCWQKCVDESNGNTKNPHQPFIVLEDDVVVNDFAKNQFREMVSEALSKLQIADESWDVLLLGAIGCVHPQKRGFGLNIIPCLVGGKWRQMRRIANLAHAENTAGCVHIPMCPYGCHAYVISPKGAAKLLRRCKDGASYHVDVVAWGLPNLRIYAVHPLLVHQSNLDTTIGGLHNTNAGSEQHQQNKLKGICDSYTGFNLIWALNAPLLRVGGNLAPWLLLTNGRAIFLMVLGIVVSVSFQSKPMLILTAVYVASIVVVIRILTSAQ